MKEKVTLYKYTPDGTDNGIFIKKDVWAVKTKYGYKTKGGNKLKANQLDKVLNKKELVIYSLRGDLAEDEFTNLHKDYYNQLPEEVKSEIDDKIKDINRIVKNIDESVNHILTVTNTTRNNSGRLPSEHSSNIQEDSGYNLNEWLHNQRWFSFDDDSDDEVIEDTKSDVVIGSNNKVVNCSIGGNISNVGTIYHSGGNSRLDVTINGKNIKIKNNGLYVNNKYLSEVPKGSSVAIRSNHVYINDIRII